MVSGEAADSASGSAAAEAFFSLRIGGRTADPLPLSGEAAQGIYKKRRIRIEDRMMRMRMSRG